ncbi:hypothetical protein LTR70_006645 [Exophiala xenobiotica]|uniref:Uncharacterized protein n=1 Tax=Lithohypha guttulata TaxID=1690604 RepID=A0ABR0KNK0_9EURO|nr:hypothetical protein LTR24_000357 [Lithohypha guttulata]KAK5315654.1 hypothetical protein LTR70_006645 [Exophiala xenobiotica]
MSTEHPESPDSSPNEGRQDITRQDPNQSDIDNDGEDLSEADDTTSISGCPTPPGLKHALSLDDLAINDKPNQHATPVADVNGQLTTTQLFIPGFVPSPMVQERYRDELRQRIDSKAPPDSQLTRILQVARWDADIAVDIFHLWHELGPPPNRSPKRSPSDRPQQLRPTSLTEADIDEIEAADIEEARRKSAAKATAADREMRAIDESSSPLETDKEESRDPGEERKVPDNGDEGHSVRQPSEAAEGREGPLDGDVQRLGTDINAASGGLSRGEIAERRQVALRSTQSRTRTQPPRSTQAPPKKKLHGPWEEGTRTPGSIRAGNLKVKQRELLVAAPQDGRPQPPATEPSTQTPRPEPMQPVSSPDEQVVLSTELATLVLRGSTQESSPTTLPSTEPPTLTLRGRTQQMALTAQKAEDQGETIPGSNNDDQPNEPGSMQYENVFPPHEHLLNPAPPSARPRKPRPRHTMAEALGHVKAKKLRREAAEAAAAAESSGTQSEQAISNDPQSPLRQADRTLQRREAASSVDENSDGVQDLTRNVDGHDVSAWEDVGRQPMEDSRLANILSKEDKCKDG